MNKILILLLLIVALTGCKKVERPAGWMSMQDTQMMRARQLVKENPRLQPMFDQFIKYHVYIDDEEMMELIKWSLVDSTVGVVR